MMFNCVVSEKNKDLVVEVSMTSDISTFLHVE